MRVNNIPLLGTYYNNIITICVNIKWGLGTKLTIDENLVIHKTGQENIDIFFEYYIPELFSSIMIGYAKYSDEEFNTHSYPEIYFKERIGLRTYTNFNITITPYIGKRLYDMFGRIWLHIQNNKELYQYK
jgi:hypothetical protein